jgi:hypothetical protein
MSSKKTEKGIKNFADVTWKTIPRKQVEEIARYEATLYCLAAFMPPHTDEEWKEARVVWLRRLNRQHAKHRKVYLQKTRRPKKSKGKPNSELCMNIPSPIESEESYKEIKSVPAGIDENGKPSYNSCGMGSKSRLISQDIAAFIPDPIAVQKMIAFAKTTEHLLRKLFNDLPLHRDWLGSDLERQIKYHLKILK